MSVLLQMIPFVRATRAPTLADRSADQARVGQTLRDFARSARARASACRRAAGASVPHASNRTTSLSSRPKVSGPRLPISSGTFLRTRFSSPCTSRSPLSAAKPTQYGGCGSFATEARMSGFSTKVKRRQRLVGGLLDLVLAHVIDAPVGDGRHPMKMSASGDWRASRRRAFAARFARPRGYTPHGVSSATGPAIRCTSAPACARRARARNPSCR